MDKKIGVYICSGCEIGDAVDLDKLVEIAKEKGVSIVKTNASVCSPAFVDEIKGDIANEGVNTVVIAACSPRVKTDIFNFPGCIVERVNIREFVAWVMEPKSDDAQLAAQDYLRMGIVKAEKTNLPEPWIGEDLSEEILVIGGGTSGLSSAIESSKAGFKVTVIEKEDKLGGWAAKWYKTTPTKYPFTSIEEPAVFQMIKTVEADPNITVLLNTTIVKTEGMPGLFDITLNVSDQEQVKRFGTIIAAAGFTPYDASKLDKLGFGVSPDVISNVDFERMVRETGKITRPSDGKVAKRVAFVLCAGSRDPEHLPYCSGYCCAASLKQAKYVRDINDGVAYVLYKDMRTPSQFELFYKEIQNDPGILLTKCEIKEVSLGEDSSLNVDVTNTLLGDDLSIEADLVVLVVGMVSNASKEKPDILNLQYRQGLELPLLDTGYFPDSNYVCFPYESRRTGIYPCGTIRAPMETYGSIQDSIGAALKAIQCMWHYERGMAVHPRGWEKSYPQVFMQRCTSCKRCTEECPFGAIDEDEKGTPFYKFNRCRRCGTCMGACPERIISFHDFSIDMINSMIKEIEVPEDDDEKLRYLAFICENDAYPALDAAAFLKHKFPPGIRFIPLRCAGNMNLVWIADGLGNGLDGALVLGCKFGENYQCHYIKGSELCNYRFGKIGETLDRLGLEAERVEMMQVQISDYVNIADTLKAYADRVKEIGPNPFKGF